MDTGVMGAVNSLKATIIQFNEHATNQTAEMIKLTSQIKWLTVVMLFFILVQIGIAVFK